MATFDPYSDSPFKIKNEGQEIVVHQNRLSPTTIRISWTLPKSVSCQLPQAYNGVIITLDRTATTLDKLPTNGQVYKADATADLQLHAGDKIGSALVIGAFYNDTNTTYVDVLDASTEESFYVSVHAVDQQHRYHIDGAHSYSLPYGKKEDVATAGYHIIKIGTAGITPDTLTALDPYTTYTFNMRLDDVDANKQISFLGANAFTYGDMVDAINLDISLIGSPIVSDTTPLIGSYWMDTCKKVVYKHDGMSYQQQVAIISAVDPTIPPVGFFWYDDKANTLSQWNGTSWDSKYFHTLNRDPRNPYCNDFWFNGTTMYTWNGGAWIVRPLISATIDPQNPPIMTCAMYWVNDDKLYNWNESTCSWKQLILALTPPIQPNSGDIYYDSTNASIKVWDSVDGLWISMPTFVGNSDPSQAVAITQGTVWFDNIADQYYYLDGTTWVLFVPLVNAIKPQVMVDGAYWYNVRDNSFSVLQMGLWTRFSPVVTRGDPTIPALDSYWVNTTNTTLQQWDGASWISLTYVTQPEKLVANALWYNPITTQLKRWTTKAWEPTNALAKLSINDQGHLVFTSGSVGSTSNVYLTNIGNLWNSTVLTPLPMPQQPTKGTDPVSSVPSYLQLGVGTDGSQDERRHMIERIKGALGYPVVEVELTKTMMDNAINMALERLRSVSSSAYKRGYFALELSPRVQHYKLTDATVGFHKVVDIFYIYRMQATFLGSAQGNSVYGQMAIQQLFNMGKFDLLSYHMVSSYIKTMQQLFAAEIQFGWDEYSRTLSIMKDFPTGERVLVDAMLERTEQDLLTDRWTRGWLQKYATAQCRYMLAEIRGKFSTLPGAGGNVSLNSADLRQKADAEILECQDEVDNFIVNDKNSFGVATDFVLG